VQTPKYTIQVLGTEFNVKAYHNSPLFETALIKGSVEITSPELSQSLRLKPDEIAVANNISHLGLQLFQVERGPILF